MNQTDQFLIVLDHQTFIDEREGIEFVLDFFRINILSVGSQQHSLRAALDKEVAFGIHCPQITCMVPAILVDGLFRRSRVFIVAQHDIQALGQDLSRYVLRIRAVDS